MEKTQFETLMLAITGLDAKFTAKFDELDAKFNGQDAKFTGKFNDLDTRLDRLEAKVDAGFLEVRKDIQTIAKQTAKTVSDVNELRARAQNPTGH